MKKLINWHKKLTILFMMKTSMDSYQLAWFSWFKGLAMGVILMVLLSGCSTLFNAEKYNPNPKPVVKNCCPNDSIRIDIINILI